MGILFAFVALVSWGFGDFLIQKSTRKFGDWIALLYITAFGTLILFPFVFHELDEVFFSLKNLSLLILTSTLMLFVALFEFEALRIGKISVIEPILALEVLVTVALSIFILREYLDFLQSFLVAGLFAGIFLISVRSFRHLKNFHLEKGVWYALFATCGMGAVNFLFGIGSRTISPLLVNWFTNFFIAVLALVYIFFHRRHKEIFGDFRKNPKLIFGVSIIDNIAWIAYSYSTLFIPISIAIGISESYIALAASLGLFFNKEKLKKHQFVGFVLCFISIIVLAIITET